LSAETKKLTSQIKKLNENIETLTKVTAINIAKEEIFKGKQGKMEKIQALKDYDLPDKIIALVVGSTSGSVKSLRSQKKGSAKGNKKKSSQESGHSNGQETV